MTPIVINTIIVCSIALFIGVVGYILSQPDNKKLQSNEIR